MMLPLWKVAQALGWTVTWLPEENGTRIENEDQVMNLTYGLDRYACASKSSIGVTSPEHYGAARWWWRDVPTSPPPCSSCSPAP